LPPLHLGLLLCFSNKYSANNKTWPNSIPASGSRHKWSKLLGRQRGE
jgi:hypothetical protein